jgi:DNA gyrase subunit A
VMLMSTGGTVIRMPVEGIRRAGRATQGVIVMRVREGEQVSTIAPVAEQAANGSEAEMEPGGAPADVDGASPASDTRA